MSPTILNYIQLVHLRQALTVVEEGSFLRAGKRLNTNHSRVSRRIRELEDTIGVTIFSRNGMGARPTPEGADFLRNVRRVLVDLENVLTLANTAGATSPAHLSIGFYVSILQGGIRSAIRQFVGLYPDTSLRYWEGSRAELAIAMNNRAVDVMISTSKAPLSDSSMPLWRDRILVMLRADHPLATKSVVDWQSIASERIILRRHEVGIELRDLLFSRIGDTSGMHIVYQHIERDSLLVLVRNGEGIALVYETDKGNDLPDVVYREIQGNGQPAWVRYWAHWRADNTNPALGNFLRVLRQRYACKTEGTA